jgi:hypothetical protein
MAGSPPSLWITGAAANPHRLPKVSNRWWRSLSAKLVAKGLREPVGAQAISFPPRPRTEGRGHGVRTDPCTAGNVLSQSPRFALMSRACRQRSRLEIGHEFDMRFTSEAARFGSLVPPATSPLTASMPSTVGLCRVAALRLTSAHPRPSLTAPVRADW